MNGEQQPKEISKKMCMECGAKCCRNICIEIEAPTTRQFRENIRWYLAHKNVSIFVEEGSWYIEFHTDCEMRTPENACLVYHNRPLMCRGYGYDDDGDINCFISNLPFNYEYEFHTLEEFDRYLTELSAKSEQTRKKRTARKSEISA